MSKHPRNLTYKLQPDNTKPTPGKRTQDRIIQHTAYDAFLTC